MKQRQKCNFIFHVAIFTQEQQIKKEGELWTILSDGSVYAGVSLNAGSLRAAGVLDHGGGLEGYKFAAG